MDNQISLWHFDLTIFGGVITFFYLEYFVKMAEGDIYFYG